MKMRDFGTIAGVPLALMVLLAGGISSFAQNAQPCPRFEPGSTIVEPEDLYSQGGALTVNFSYQSRVDENGNRLFCFVDEHGAQSPTLHVRPGDRLIINLKNELPPIPASMSKMPGMILTPSDSGACGATIMTADSVNLHYHGTTVPPVCHQDEVIKTIVNPGETFQYDVHFPSDEPPGLYWYHPHIHGISEAAVQGGATGAIIVEGLERANPAVAGLPQRVLMIRDGPVPGNPTPGGDVPSYDISLNYIPVPYPSFTPAVIPMKPSEKQLWRVANTCADTILNLQLKYDGVAQPLTVVALDGFPVGSQDGAGKGKSIVVDHILLSPAARAEFIVTGPTAQIGSATFSTLKINTGPIGDNDPGRDIAVIKVSPDAAIPSLLPAVSGAPPPARFAGLRSAKPTAQRKLYFSESPSTPKNPDNPTKFFITVDGQKPVLFSPDNPPAIVTTQGAVEDWVVENRALENHEFHIHQLHFLVLERNGAPVPDGQYLDMIDIPFWTGKGPYPSVKLRMDFRGAIVGDFVYHCHILGHEDAGMMAIIRVNPR